MFPFEERLEIGDTLKTIVMDLDGTLTIDSDLSYEDKEVDIDVLLALKKYKELGFTIVISTSRNMRTHKGKIGKINVLTLPGIIKWVDKHEVPYDEIIVGKPWCGFDGFYVDDKAIRPTEFANLSYEEIRALLSKENPSKVGGKK